LLVNYLSPVRRPKFYILAFNPLTSETETFIPDFPNMAIWGPAGWNVTESSYDPSLTFVVYGVGANLGKWVDIVLWDIQAQQEIVRLENPSGGSSTPVWSPDGKQFVVDVSPDQTHQYDYDELFSVSRDGVIQRLTFLTDYYEKVEIRDYSWSPDSHRVAFWYSFEDGTVKIGWDYYLAIYDTSEQKLTSYYIRRGENSLFSLPILPPESNMLLVDGFIGSTETAVADQTLLLDVLNNQAFVIASDMIPVGWLVSMP
jgi:WD40 repeat protein